MSTACVRQVQRERGVSCASVASRGTLEYFDVLNFRERTDATNSADEYGEQLGTVRGLVDVNALGAGADPIEPAMLASNFYAVFASYCAICEELLMEQDAMVGQVKSSQIKYSTPEALLDLTLLDLT